MPENVRWPANALDAEGADLGAPLTVLLKELKLDGAQVLPSDNGFVSGIIESTVMSVTKEVKKLITGAGILTAAGGGAGSIAALANEEVWLAFGLAIGTAVVIAAALLALAIVINSDISGRAATTVEQTTARAAVATAYLEAAGSLVRARGEVAAGAPTNGRHAVAIQGADIDVTDGPDSRVAVIQLKLST
jgi:hypothetical protein